MLFVVANPWKIVMHVNRRKESERMGIQFECPVCGHKNNTPQTNADRIRSMSDEELAAWIVSMTTVCECCAEINECESPKCFNKCLHGVEDWLQQPPKGRC